MNNIIYNYKKKSENYGFLEDILKIYNYKILGDNTSYVKSVWKSNRKRKMIQNSARLIVTDQISDNDILKHIIYRHPISINGPDYYDINEDNMYNTLGYKKEDVFPIKNNISLRYAIVAETPIDKLSNSIIPHTWIIHTWGVNLESVHTQAVKYLFIDNRFNIELYLKLLRPMFDVILGGALSIYDSTNKLVVLRIPGIGLGVWSKYIPKKCLEVIKSAYKQMVMDMHIENCNYIQIRYVKRSETVKTPFLNNDIWTWKTVESNDDPFGKPKNHKDNYFIPYPVNSVNAIVNAWDDRSFIGNGGSEDDSMDGIIVSGGYHTSKISDHWNQQLGLTMSNASYMHNVFFCPNLLDTTKWIRV